MTGYSRAAFGPAWSDVDDNGCDTRNDVLARDLVDDVVAVDGCTILTGTLDDPYTGTTIVFVRGAATSGHVQVDHVVSLADAWRSGAAGWTTAKREYFANDPTNLLATRGSVNQAKSDSNAAEWLPPDRGYRCDFVRRQIRVKDDYDLSVTPGEKAAMQRVLRTC